MSRSRRQNLNTVNAPALARWIVLTGFLGLTGLIYVYLTIQLHHQGDRKKILERELTSLRSQNEAAGSRIAALTSRSALQRRQKEGSLKMISITERDILRLNQNLSTRTRAEDSVQPVVNQRAGR